MATRKIPKPQSHILFLGVTMSGKTTAARMYSRAYCKHRIPVVVFDPVGSATLGGDWGEGAKVYQDAEEFIDYLHSGKLQPCKMFIDEASSIFAHGQHENFWLAERGRHYGIQLHTITQRPMRIHPSVRDQHAEAYVFRLKSADIANVGADFGHDLRDIQLDAGEYLHLISGRVLYTRGNVFKEKGLK